jgi:Cdc6-like AAA superfamily ATPase
MKRVTTEPGFGSRKRPHVPADNELADEEPASIEWLGACFETEKSATSYEKVRVDGITYSVGDNVYVHVMDVQKPQPMKLTHLWQDDDGRNCARGNWYYHCGEIKAKEVPFALLENELFASDWGDDMELESFCGKFSLTQDVAKTKKGSKARLCRLVYDPHKKVLHPLSSRKHLADILDDEDEADGEKPDPNDRFSSAIAALELSAIPKAMPCRDGEKKIIQDFLFHGIRNGGSRASLYISGMPGTGKTASVHEVISHLRELQHNKELARFDYLEVNGLKVSFPDECYSIIAEQILPDRPVLNASKAAKALEAHFNREEPHRRVTVLLIDEIDQLVTKKQQLLYDLFDWPQHPQAKLVVLSVSNTINFPETLLPRIQSRMGKDRVTFHPYSREQLQTIIAQRLSATNVFNKDAIEFAARKVALLSGDVRRALQLCRRAIAVCVRTGGGEVGMGHVNAAVRDIDARPHCQTIATLSLPQKAFLICVHKHCSAIGAEAALFQDVLRRFLNLCQTHVELQRIVSLAGPAASSRRALLLFALRLAGDGLITIDNDGARVSEGPLLGLAFDFEDMRVALQSDSDASALL